jgi:aspartate dehydrogenase
MRLTMRVGLIGLGAIGRGVVQLLRADDDVELVGALVGDPRKRRGSWAPPICATLDELLEKRPEVIVELAGHAALQYYGPKVASAGIDLIVVSVGALAHRDVEEAIVHSAQKTGSRVFVASGAIGALDAIASAAVCGGLRRVTHTTRKPARTLLDPAEAADLTEPRELFRGSAREGALRFPESINVAAAVSLAGIGLDRTEVCVIADPSAERNSHEVVAQGEFGDLRFEIRNIPTDDNPRTGRLVAMSIVHALRQRHATLVVG